MMIRGARFAGLLWSMAILSAAGCCCVDRAPAPRREMVEAGPRGCSTCGPCAEDDFFCQGPVGAALNVMSCGSGCGEWYVDEWISDPPACEDPCDNWGNYVGHRPCAPALLDCWHRLWGTRYTPGQDCGGSCRGGSPYSGRSVPSYAAPRGMPREGQIEIVEPWHDVETSQEPTPAAQSTKRKPPKQVKYRGSRHRGR